MSCTHTLFVIKLFVWQCIWLEYSWQVRLQLLTLQRIIVLFIVEIIIIVELPFTLCYCSGSSKCIQSYAHGIHILFWVCEERWIPRDFSYIYPRHTNHDHIQCHNFVNHIWRCSLPYSTRLTPCLCLTDHSYACLYLMWHP